MRILIFFAATGGGHRRTAGALESYFHNHMPGAQVQAVDSLKAVHMMVDKMICGSYHFMATKAPRAYGVLYKQTQKPSADVVPCLSSICCRKLLPIIQDFQPDVIFTCHPFAGEMVSQLKRRGKIHQPLVAVVTDYGAHRSYVTDQVNAYVVPSMECADMLSDMGVPRQKIYPFGIPVYETFFHSRSRGELQKAFGLQPGRKTVLLMAGSFGVTQIQSIYQSLMDIREDFQMVVITGKNKKMYETFHKMIERSGAKSRVKLVFFTTEVEKYMQASDLLITKPGGLTISEALACRLPLAVFDAIPGQEEDNAQFLVDHGMGVRLENEQCGKVVGDLLAHPETLQRMQEACGQVDLAHTCEKIVALIEELVQQEREESAPMEKKRPMLHFIKKRRTDTIHSTD